MSIKTKRIWLYSIFLAAVIIRIPGLFGGNWYDENFSLLVASLDTPGLLAATAGDVHPPLYYLILRLWMTAFGYTVVSARVLSAVFGVLAVVVFWHVVAEWVERDRDRLILTGLFALNGFAVYFSNEIRMYSLLMLLYLLAVWAIHDWRWWLISLTVAALMYTHHYGLFYGAVLGVYAIFRAVGTHERRRVVSAFAIAAAAWLVWGGLILYSQMFLFTAGSGHWIDAPNVGTILQTLSMQVFGIINGPLTVLSTIVTGGLMSLLLLNLRRNNAGLLWLAFGPLAIAVTVSCLVTPIYLYRALIGMVPFMIIVLYWPLLSSPYKFRDWLVASAFFIPLLGAGLVYYYVDRDIARIGPGLFAGLDVDPARDIVYTTTDGPHIDLLWNNPDLDVYQMPECVGTNDQGALSDQTRDALGMRIAALDTLDYNRAWIVHLAGPNSDPCRLAMAERLIDGLEPVKIIKDESVVWMAIYEVGNSK